MTYIYQPIIFLFDTFKLMKTHLKNQKKTFFPSNNHLLSRNKLCHEHIGIISALSCFKIYLPTPVEALFFQQT